MSGTPPPRPGMRRHSSAVRFSRGDRSPIGTLTSDDSTQGVGHPPSQGGPQAPPPGGAYDVNTYPTSERSASVYTNPYYNSEADDTELESRTQRDSAASVETITPASRVQADPYTATPPRVSTRRMTNPNPMVPPPEVREAFATPPSVHRQDEMVSPRSNPSEWGSPRHDWQPQSPSPIHRPLPRDSLAQSPARRPGTPSEWGSPRAQWQAQPPSPTPARLPSALKNSSPALQPYPGNPYSPSTSPYMGSPQRNPDYPSRPATEARPAPTFGPPKPSASSGFRRFDENAIPPEAQAPPYPPMDAQIPSRPEAQAPAEPRFSLSEWQEYQRQQQWQAEKHPSAVGQREQQQWQSDGRHDSDETLREGYTMNSDKPPLPAGDGRYLQPDDGGMRRRTTREMEDDDQSYHVKGGVFSQLLRLAGRSNTQLRRRQMSGGASSQGEPEVPTMSNLGIRSRASSLGSTVFHGEEVEPEDPRMTGKKPNHKRPTWDETGYTHTDTHGRRRKSSIQLHVADILTRQRFVMTLAKALMVFGAPSHRVESQLNATASVLEIDAQFIHLPSIVIASFGDLDTRTSETHFIKASGGLDLGKLHRVHRIYRSVVHDEVDAAEGTKQIKALLRAPSIYNVWHRICLSFLSAGIAAPMAFGGSFVDGLASGCLGVMLSFWQLHVASNSSMYSNIFEISIATVISFTARGLSTTGIFCYQAVASAGVTLILPGYVILCGSLELATKNIVSGSVRMVYAIIYSLFLGFGITIGSDMFFVLDRKAKRAQEAAIAASQNFVTMTGSFMPLFVNSSYYPDISSSSPMIPFNGTFTFSNHTSSNVDASLKAGHVVCDRPAGLPWYQQNMPRIYCIPLVPIFSLLIALWNMQPIKSKQLPVMITISCIGYLTNTMANKYIFDRSDVVSAIGAFVIGVLGNVYSRVFGGTAFTSMVPGVLFLVPSGISAAGGLAMTNMQNHSDSYSQGLIIGFRMVQVAIGITVGLFGSGLLIYSFGRKKGSALFAF